MDISAEKPRVLWSRIFALAALSGAITFAWLTYVLYLPKLLTQLGFPPVAVPVLLVAEGLLGAVVEPWMGSLSDTRQRRAASRYPLIIAGTLAACGLFVALPLVVSVGPIGPLHWALPLLLIAWSFAMAVFRSPAFALLSRYASPSSVPMAAAVLSAASGLAGALGLFGRPWLLHLGSFPVFALASAVLLLTVLVLGRLERSDDLSLPYGSIYVSGRLVPAAVARSFVEPDSLPPPSAFHLVLIFCAGIGASLGFRMLTECLPLVLKPLGIAPPLVVGTLFLTVAVLALPAGAVAVRVGNGRTMCFGLVAMAGLLSCVPLLGSATAAFALAALLGIAHSLVTNGLYAFALSAVPPDRAGLGLGLYFGGGGVAMAVAGALAAQLPSLGIGMGVLVGCMGFLTAALCVALAGTNAVSGQEPVGHPDSARQLHSCMARETDA